MVDGIPGIENDKEEIETIFTDNALRRRYLDEYPDALAARTITINSGTSFPSSPSDGQLFLRTDQGKFYLFLGSDWRQILMLDTSGNAKITGRYLKE